MIPMVIINEDSTKQSICERVMLQHAMMLMAMADDSPIPSPIVMTRMGLVG